VAVRCQQLVSGGSSMMLVNRSGLERRKRSGLDTSKTLRGESAIALRYC